MIKKAMILNKSLNQSNFRFLRIMFLFLLFSPGKAIKPVTFINKEGKIYGFLKDFLTVLFHRFNQFIFI